jgi:hypothetical protein
MLLAGFFFLYRRRGMRFKGLSSGGLGGLAIFKRRGRGEGEWEIVDAEKIEIVHGASSMSVSTTTTATTSRGESRDGRIPEGRGAEVRRDAEEMMRLAAARPTLPRVPVPGTQNREKELPSVLVPGGKPAEFTPFRPLASHPPGPPPAPPSREEKGGSWPLPEG